MVKAMDGDQGQTTLFAELAAGWPMISVHYCVLSFIPSTSPPRFEPEWAGLGLSRKPGLLHALPVLPIWTGFVVNTVVYATVTMGAMLAPGWVVRRRRRRRGLCVWCGYPRGEGEVCSECGKEL